MGRLGIGRLGGLKWNNLAVSPMASSSSRLPGLVLTEMESSREQAKMNKPCFKFATTPLAEVGHMAQARVSVSG